jgi:hypothetical protein
MFVPNFEKSIPGYTGHRPEKVYAQENLQQQREPTKHIPGKYSALFHIHYFLFYTGYQGYVPSVKSENVYGLTYGKTSFQSNAQMIVKGMDLPPHLRYDTSMKKEFIDHSKRSHLVETTAQIVGVDKGETCFKKVSSRINFHANCFIFNVLASSTLIHSRILRISSSRRDKEGRRRQFESSARILGLSEPISPTIK